MKRIGFLLCLFVLAGTVAGCISDKSPLESVSRTDQEKAFAGDPSKTPAWVKDRAANPPMNSQPVQPVPR